MEERVESVNENTDADEDASADMSVSDFSLRSSSEKIESEEARMTRWAGMLVFSVPTKKIKSANVGLPTQESKRPSDGTEDGSYSPREVGSAECHGEALSSGAMRTLAFDLRRTSPGPSDTSTDLLMEGEEVARL